MKIYNSIYDLKDLTAEEEDFALNNSNIENVRAKLFWSRRNKYKSLKKILPRFVCKCYDDWLWERFVTALSAPKTKSEYLEFTNQHTRYKHIFYILMMRGDFNEARKYEILAEYDFVKSFESIPSDLFMKNEIEYYDWRRQQL